MPKTKSATGKPIAKRQPEGAQPLLQSRPSLPAWRVRKQTAEREEEPRITEKKWWSVEIRSYENDAWIELNGCYETIEKAHDKIIEIRQWSDRTLRIAEVFCRRSIVVTARREASAT